MKHAIAADLCYRRRGRELRRPHGSRPAAGHLPRVHIAVVQERCRPEHRRRRPCMAAPEPEGVQAELPGATAEPHLAQPGQAEAEVEPDAALEQRRRAEREQRAEKAALRSLLGVRLRRHRRRRRRAEVDGRAAHRLLRRRAQALAGGAPDGDVAEGAPERPVAAAGAAEVARLRRVVVVVVAELGVVRRAPRALLPRRARGRVRVRRRRLQLHQLLLLLEARHVRRGHGRRGVVLAVLRTGEQCLLHGGQLVQRGFHGVRGWPGPGGAMWVCRCSYCDNGARANLARYR
uniref:Uncharacterized protein n=1 Tax=Triticum urartu TaxID=4572 RepID=A0A8R7Q0A3_TRIUA